MPSRRRNVQFLGGAMTAICELMSSFGLPKATAEEQLKLALKSGYARGARRPSRAVRSISKMADVCTRWHLEKAYVNKEGKPRPLTWNGHTGSLLTLAKRVVGKPRAKFVIEDLVRRKQVRRTADGSWIPKAQVVSPAGLDSAQVLRSATMLDRLLRTIAYNSELGYRGDVLLEVMAQVPRLPVRELPKFKKFAKSQGLVFIKTMDDWLETRNLQRGSRKRLPIREAGVVAFAFEQPSFDN